MTAPEKAAPIPAERIAFGDAVTNIAASDDNPIKYGWFIRRGKKSGRLNAGAFIEYVTVDGRMHKTPPDNIARRPSEPMFRLADRAAALEASASGGCMCQDVEIGSHAASVSVPIPDHMADYREARVADGLSSMIAVDACLVVELRQLWDRGIRTYGSCCGHNRTRGMINVHEDDAEKMRVMGYEQWPAEDGTCAATFYPKSVRGGASAAEGERGWLAAVDALDEMAKAMDEKAETFRSPNPFDPATMEEADAAVTGWVLMQAAKLLRERTVPEVPVVRSEGGMDGAERVERPCPGLDR